MTRSPTRGASRRTTRRMALATLAAAALLGATGLAQAAFPDKPIRIVVPWPAGGLVDIPARLVGEKLSAALGQQVLVDNKTGAGGAIGADIVAKAAPDGYTLLVTTSAMSINQALGIKQPFDPIKDFQPVAIFATAPLILVTTPGKGVDSVADLVDKARKAPGKLTYASAGNGTPAHLAAEWFKAEENIDVVHVPYRGAPPAMVDQVAGRVDFHFSNAAVGLPQIAAGKVTALAIASPKRLEQLPQVPTMIEAGVKDFDTEQWIGLLAPKGTPAALVQRLNDLVRDAISAPDVRAAMTRAGMVPATPASVEAFSATVRADLDKWTQVVKTADIKLD
jgi:tripartite-type tricarboxylate transporter receptor subunit TctC